MEGIVLVRERTLIFRLLQPVVSTVRYENKHHWMDKDLPRHAIDTCDLFVIPSHTLALVGSCCASVSCLLGNNSLIVRSEVK